MANASYAITASFGSLSTDPQSRNCISKEDGIAKAMANLQYIMRFNAVDPLRGGALLYRTDGLTHHVPMKVEERNAFIEMCEEKLGHRARKHTKSRGVRLLDKAIVSLPADANCHQRIEIAELAIAQFAGDSDATVVAAIHTDRSNNPHIHLWMIDGPESREQALARTKERTRHTKSSRPKKSNKTIQPERRRVRRQDYIRLGDLGSRAKARMDVAAVINIVANREGLRRAETRSLEEQGLDKKPQIHEGPQAAQKARREEHVDFAYHGILTPRVRRRVLRNIDTVIENNTQSFLNTESVSPTIFPERLRPFCVMVYDLIEKKAQQLRSQLKLDLFREEKCKEIEAEALLVQQQVEQKRQQEEEHEADKEKITASPPAHIEDQPTEKTRSIQAQPAMTSNGDFGQNLIRNKRLAEGRPLEYSGSQMTEEEYERLKSRPPIHIPEPFSKKVSTFAKQLLPKALAVGVGIKEAFDEVIESRTEKKRQKQQAEALERLRAEKLAEQEEQDKEQSEDQLVQSAVSALTGERKEKPQVPFDQLDAASYEREVNLETDEADWLDDFEDEIVDLESHMEKPHTVAAPKQDKDNDPIIVKTNQVRTSDQHPPTKMPSDANAGKATQLTRARYREPEIRITTPPPSRQQTRPTPPIAPTPEKKTPHVTPSTTKPAQKSGRGLIRVRKKRRDRGMER